MPLSREEVEHLGRLTRVGLSDDDIARFQQQLSQILDHFQMLQQVDTADVEPTTHTLALLNVERDDVARPSSPQNEALANAPQVEDGFIRVRAVLE